MYGGVGDDFNNTHTAAGVTIDHTGPHWATPDRTGPVLA